MTIRNALLGASLLALLAPAAAYAQQTTGAFQGVVRNADDKAPVANATVTIVNVPSGTRTVVRTDAAGAFSAVGLRVGGPYQITATATGLGAQSIGNLYLTVADLQKISLDLTPELEQVTVTSRPRPTALVADVGSRTVLRAADIEAVVSVKRDIRDVGRRDPLAQLDFVNRGTGPSGGLYIAGSLPRSNRITIDGERAQDDFGLNTGGLSTNRGPVSLEAVEQISIVAVPFDVEDGDFTGGALNLILKSGGNDFHGTLFGFDRETRLAGNRLPLEGFVNNDVTQPRLTGYGKVANPIKEKNYGGFFSGPIIKDKLFFSFSYENFESQDTTSYGPVDGGFANAFNPIPGISKGTRATTADINAVLANYINGYAAAKVLPPGQDDLTQPIEDHKLSFKLDWNIANGQRLTASYRNAFSEVTKRSPSATTISLDTNWYSQPENEDNYLLQLNSTWTPKFSTEIRGSFRDYQRGQLPPEGQGFANIALCTDPTSAGTVNSCTSGSPTVQIGPDQFRQANALKTTDLAGQFVGNYRLTDTNEIKVGYQFKGIHVYDLFVQQAHGVYYFDSIADLNAGRANQLSYNSALTGDPNDAAERFSYQVHTVFAQDTWDVLPGLTLTGGLRADVYNSNVLPTLNNNFLGRYGFTNQSTYDGRHVVMPRFTARWRTQWFELSGGIGLVSGGIPDVFIGNSYGAQTGALTNGFVVKRTTSGSDAAFTETAANLPITPAQGIALLDLNKADPSFVTTQGATAQALVQTDSAARRLAFTNSIAPNFALPSDWKANVSFHTTQYTFDFGIDAVMSFSNDNIAFRDLRARPLTQNGVQLYTPDGRIRYDGLVVTAANRAAMGLPVAANPDLTNIGLNGDIQAYNPSQGSFNETVAFSVGHRPWHGLEGLVSYTIQNGRSAGGISEFGTTEGGNSSTGNYYADQTFARDPNGIATGKSTNLISNSAKLNLTYKVDFVPGWTSRFTLFGEVRDGRPFSLLMSDPTVSGGRSPAFGVTRDDALAYIPNLASPDAANPLKFTTGGTTVFFDSAASVAKLQALVNQFHLPLGQVLARGVGQNPHQNRIDFQYAQDIPLPHFLVNNQLVFTMDIQNLGNLLDKKWGVVKEFTNSRAGGVIVNAQCADANGVIAGTGSPVCSTYRYSYTTANPVTLATPTVDQIASLYTIEFGLKYKF